MLKSISIFGGYDLIECVPDGLLPQKAPKFIPDPNVMFKSGNFQFQSGFLYKYLQEFYEDNLELNEKFFNQFILWNSYVPLLIMADLIFNSTNVLICSSD